MYQVKVLSRSTIYERVQWIVKFENGYGASILNFTHEEAETSGLFEVAVTLNGKLLGDPYFGLDFQEVAERLDEIKSRPSSK